MAITLGVHASAGATQQTANSTPSRTTTPGSALYVVITSHTGHPAASVSDNKGNSFARIGTITGGSGQGGGFTEQGEAWVATNIAGGANHIVSVSGAYFPSIAYQEVKGNGVALDVFAQAADTATPFQPGSVTPTANGCAVLSGIAPHSSADPAFGVAAPLAMIEQIIDYDSFWPLALAGYVQGTAEAINPSWTATNSTQGNVHVAAFKETGAPAAIAGTGSATLGALTSAAAAAVLITAAATATLGALTGQGAAGSDTARHAVGSATLGALTGAATARSRIAATAAKTLGLVVGTAAATHGDSVPPVLGAHTVVWSRNGEGTNPQSTPALTTQSGSTLLVVLSCGSANNVSPTDNKGNTFIRQGSRVEYELYPGFGVNVFAAEDIVGGANHVVSVNTSGAPFEEFTMFVAEIRNTSGFTGGVVMVEEPGDLVTAPVTTTKPSLLLTHWWGDDSSGPHTAVARDGFTALESVLEAGSLIQGAAAYKVQPAPGTYTAGWDETPQQGAILSLFAFEGEATSGTEITASASQTLGGLTGTATAAARIAATSGATLGALAGSGAAGAHIAGTVAATLGALQGAATAAAPIRASAAATLGELLGQATGGAQTGIAASAAATLGPLSGSASAAQLIAAQGASTLGPLLASGAAGVDVRAVAAAVLGALTSNSTAAARITATAARTLGSLIGQAWGVSGEPSGEPGPAHVIEFTVELVSVMEVDVDIAREIRAEARLP